jgi:hypothetical protein
MSFTPLRSPERSCRCGARPSFEVHLVMPREWDAD